MDRALAVLNMLQKALWSASAGGERLPTVEVSIIVDDISGLNGESDTSTAWAFGANIKDDNHKRLWMIPDFSLYSAPATGSWNEMQRIAQRHDSPFTSKIPKVVWRGVKWTNEAIRGALLDRTEGQEWADVAVVNWDTRQNLMTSDQNCDYAFTVYTEGRSYSGRLPFMLNCDSIALVHPFEWNTYFNHLLIGSGKEQNYVPVERDFSDLESRVKYYLDNPTQAQRIIQNSVRTFRQYTSSTATSCYLRSLIQSYSEVSFAPEVMRPAGLNTIARERGIPFEEFIYLGHDYTGDT